MVSVLLPRRGWCRPCGGQIGRTLRRLQALCPRHSGWPNVGSSNPAACRARDGGVDAPAGEPAFVRRFLNPLRTRTGVSLFGSVGFSQGLRRSVASGRASRSWAWAAITSQVHRSAASELQSRGVVHSSVYLNRRNVCSMSKRRRKDCQQRSKSASVASARDHRSQTGLLTPPLGSF